MPLRRTKGTGSMTKRKDGYYVGRYRGVSVYAKNKDECERKLRDLINLQTEVIAQSDDPIGVIPNIESTIAEWLRTRVAYLKPTSFDRLDQTVKKHIVNRIGKFNINSISEDMFMTHVIRPMAFEGLSFSSIKKAQDAFCPYTRWLVSKRYLNDDPMRTFQKITKQGINSISITTGSSINNNAQDHICVLSDELRARFVEACRAHYSSSKPRFAHGELFILMLYTGLRMGEVLALRWDCVDLDGRKIIVRATANSVRDRNPRSSTYGHMVTVVQPFTKTNRPRVVPLGDMAYEACRNLWDHRTSNEFVASTKDGGLLQPQVFLASLDRVYKFANIKLGQGTSSHALRHTFASMCFKSGMDVKTVSELLGHSSIQITMDIYVHLMGEKSLETIPQLLSLK